MQPVTRETASTRAEGRLEEHLDAEILSRATPIERVRFAGRTQLDPIIRAGVPVILTDAMNDWPAMSKWTLDYFDERWGRNTARWIGKVIENGRTPYECNVDDVRAHGTVADFIRALRADDPTHPVYVHQNDADSMYPGSRADLRYETLLEGADRLQPNIWLGTRGTRSGLHWDPPDNFATMILGAKGFVLSPAGAHRKLYATLDHPTKSAVDPAKVDWARFPRFRSAKLITGVLRRGEVLFLPAGWWHYFVALQTSISTSIWFGRSVRMIPLKHFGPEHAAAFIKQFVWNGVLGRGYERRALAAYLPGALAYEAIKKKLKRR